jgi:hypothetical protein
VLISPRFAVPLNPSFGLFVVFFLVGPMILPTVSAQSFPIDNRQDFPIKIRDIELVTLDGNVAEDCRTSGPLVAKVTMENLSSKSQIIYVIMEVRDQDDITQILEWQSGVIGPRELMEAGFSWTPDSPGIFKLRAFTISNLTYPATLSEVHQTDVDCQ